MLKIKPVFSEKIWGGKRLKDDFNFKIPSNQVGEAWLISGYKNYESKIEGTPLNLQEFYETNKEEFNNYPSVDFPLLVKILDAKEILSVQVHPDNNLAQKLENYPFGKSECWYIIDHDKDAKIIVGNKTTNKHKIKKFIRKNKWDSIYETIDSEKDLAINIDPGTIHAIGKGNLIYELQQSSDITYRFYDFDREENGKKRELHIDKAIKSIKKSNDILQNAKLMYKTKNIKINRLIENTFFNLEKWEVSKKESIFIDYKEKNFLLITNLWNQEFKINNEILKKGESAVLTKSDLEKSITLFKGTILVGNPK